MSMLDRRRQSTSVCVAWLIVLPAALSFAGFSGESISPSQAAAHVGETKTVCGRVASTKFAESSNRSPTFLNLDQPYPKQIFTAVIWGADRPKFNRAPEAAFQGKQIC